MDIILTKASSPTWKYDLSRCKRASSWRECGWCSWRFRCRRLFQILLLCDTICCVGRISQEFFETIEKLSGFTDCKISPYTKPRLHRPTGRIGRFVGPKRTWLRRDAFRLLILHLACISLLYQNSKYLGWREIIDFGMLNAISRNSFRHIWRAISNHSHPNGVLDCIMIARSSHNRSRFDDRIHHGHDDAENRLLEPSSK